MSLEVELVRTDAMRGLAQAAQTKAFRAKPKDVTTKNVIGRIYITTPRQPPNSSPKR